MGQVLIRNLPDDLVETLKTKARLKGKSLEQELRDMLEANRPFTAEERQAFSRECLETYGSPMPAMTEQQESEEGLR
jgi:plasmid stability protein